MSYFLVFCLGAVIDLMYVLWIDSVNNRKIPQAGLYSIGIAAPGIFGYLEIVSDTYMAIPYLAGLAVGTMVTLYFKKPEEKMVEMELECTPQQMRSYHEAGLITPVYNFTPRGVEVLQKGLEDETV